MCRYNLKAAVDYAFMSTTANKNVALQYASVSQGGIVLEFKMGLAGRGADIQWLSQYPRTHLSRHSHCFTAVAAWCYQCVART